MKTWSSIIEARAIRFVSNKGAERAMLTPTPRPKHSAGGAKRRNWAFRPGKPATCTVTSFA